ncbi:metallo-beta-lactamase superfamily protein [Kribbella amoyensis]|uniref:Metallo-beta-lactamase superfamily protein n=1 Tax=Kribbella amoyensis TaxID=996641 RepID=A0A561BZ16_9ACTN|nr:MBL fold metallo-hydrolase [Kribbella amoyensis]TWD84155.1 metallo-beta-lactamase superfamily protein [Kribbella amoyensis]
MQTIRVDADISVLSDQLEVPGIGFLPVNAFVLRAAEPVVVDTGLSLPGRGFMDALGSVVDPQDVRWIWLTHPDRDHTGSLVELLEAAPRARVITTFIGVGIMSTEQPLPMDRVYLLNPGQSLSVGDRTLTAFRPPLFDSPATVGFYDDRSRVCFSSDCFGAPMPSAELAVGGDVGDAPADARRAGQLLWATIDSPWVHTADPAAFRRTVQPLREMDPAVILSSHLPPAAGHNAEFLDLLETAPGADPFVGPDQRALEELLAGFEPDGQAPSGTRTATT